MGEYVQGGRDFVERRHELHAKEGEGREGGGEEYQAPGQEQPGALQGRIHEDPPLQDHEGADHEADAAAVTGFSESVNG